MFIQMAAVVDDDIERLPSSLIKDALQIGGRVLVASVHHHGRRRILSSNAAEFGSSPIGRHHCCASPLLNPRSSTVRIELHHMQVELDPWRRERLPDPNAATKGAPLPTCTATQADLEYAQRALLLVGAAALKADDLREMLVVHMLVVVSMRCCASCFVGREPAHQATEGHRVLQPRLHLTCTCRQRRVARAQWCRRVERSDSSFLTRQ